MGSSPSPSLTRSLSFPVRLPCTVTSHSLPRCSLPRWCAETVITLCALYALHTLSLTLSFFSFVLSLSLLRLQVQDLYNHLYDSSVPGIVHALLFLLPWVQYGRVFQGILAVTQPTVRAGV